MSLPNTILVAGRAGSGKSTVANYLAASRGYAIASLADPMKKFCQRIFEWDTDRLWGPSELRNAVDPAWGFSARHALQTLGTEWGRALHPEIWIRYACRGEGRRVFQDARFENEITTFRKLGALTILLEGSVAPLDSTFAAHSSETTEWRAEWFDIVIRPCKGVEVLCARVDNALEAWTNIDPGEGWSPEAYTVRRAEV